METTQADPMTDSMQVLRAQTPPSGSPHWSDALSSYSMLPPDMLERAARRLGWVALFYLVSFPIMRLLYHIKNPLQFFQASPFPLVDIALFGAIISGGIITAVAWSGKLPPALVLDVGLLFEVLGALWIALAEMGFPFLDQIEYRGVSAITLWITMFILVIPATLGKTILAAFSTALMGPVGLLIVMLYHGVPPPEATRWLQLFTPNFVFATFAIILSRFIYQMGSEVRKVREMGSYRLMERLGAGGMGEVWRAQHRMLARPSAIKLIRPEVCSQTDDGCFYYVMELLDGFDLDTLIERYGPLPPERVVFLLLQACDSLVEAHLHGLVHRDIKPKNIFLCRLGLNYDFIKVLDFGLVKTSAANEAAETNITIAGTTTGTPAFMPPEIALGKSEVDGRADLYSLGCVAYWLLTGRLVFEGPTPLSVLLAHIQNTPEPPSSRTEIEIPAELEAVIMACLEKDPDKRPQTAYELAQRLSACPGAEQWNQVRAENWWRAHLPSLATQPAGQAAAVETR